MQIMRFLWPIQMLEQMIMPLFQTKYYKHTLRIFSLQEWKSPLFCVMLHPWVSGKWCSVQNGCYDSETCSHSPRSHFRTTRGPFPEPLPQGWEGDRFPPTKKNKAIIHSRQKSWSTFLSFPFPKFPKNKVAFPRPHQSGDKTRMTARVTFPPSLKKIICCPHQLWHPGGSDYTFYRVSSNNNCSGWT